MGTLTIPPALQSALQLLIRANHILHSHGILDATTHISIRHPLNPSHFILAAAHRGAPLAVSRMDDFIAYRISDSSPLDAHAPTEAHYDERIVHGEVLKRFPEATAVVCSRAEDVLPFTLGGVDVRPVVSGAGFLGYEPVPVFDVARIYARLQRPEQNLLIDSEPLGAALADKLSDSRPVVLQHKHGFTTFGRCVEEAVYRAVYMQINCRVLQRALSCAGGDVRDVSYLSREQVEACARVNQKSVQGCWRVWVAEVKGKGGYVCEEEGVGRMKK